MLLQRILTAAVMLAVLSIVLLWLPRSAALVALALMVLAGAWEWAGLARVEGPVRKGLYVAACAVAMLLLWRVAALPGGFAWTMTVVLAWWVASFLWLTLAPGRGGRALTAVAGLLTLAPMWIALERLYGHSGHGAELIVFLLLLVWATDIGGYFVGRRLGRYKLAPRVSPNKTWEGVLGGLVLGSLVALGGQAWFALPAAAFLPLCMAVILVSVVGDLNESLFKRQAGLKDSSAVLPGHGGVLDRIDSLTAAAPVYALGLVWLGVLS